MTEPLTVMLHLTILEDKLEAWEVFFADMRAKVAAEEPGTLKFDMNRVKGHPQRYLMIEEYADQAAWDFHSQKQTERGVKPAMRAFTAHPADFMILEPVGGSLR